MEIIDILKSSNKVIVANLDLLAKDYLEKTGKKLNKGCRACVNEMILTLKNIYNMTQFKFKRSAASYKNKVGDRTTISNSTMTDEKAIEFLKTNPKRIDLFSDFPSNWKELIEGKQETDEERENRLAIEAEVKAAEEAKSAAPEPEKATEVLEDFKQETDEELRNELMRKGLKELREMYPEIKAVSTKDFVDKVLEQEN